MITLLTSAQMRALESAAMDAGDVSGLALMARAGRGVADAAQTVWPALFAGAARRALVLCGPGNNGGDGFVIASRLRALGWQVFVHLLGDAARLPPDARHMHDLWCAEGTVTPWDAEDVASAKADLIVDALFGAGLTRPVAAEVLEPIRALRRACPEALMLAVDAPSGLCLDSGRPLDPDIGAVEADLTVTFAHLRPGHILADGPAHCGIVRVADIGLVADPAPQNPAISMVPPDGPDNIARLGKGGAGHKFDHGHALVLAGPMGRTGAARLAARGALRVGAGLVTVGAPGSAMLECASQLTSIMLRRCDDAAALLEDRRINALCLGPGLGAGAAAEPVRVLVATALASGRATVLDADALNAFEDRPETLFAQLHHECVLTPHGGEFARLFPDLSDRLTDRPRGGPAFSRADAARLAAERAGCTVLLKGAVTAIGTPGDRVVLHAGIGARAAPWLATAGSGDVLSGILAGLLARGFAAEEAAPLAAWLHVEAARAFGPGLIAEDLPEALPQVLASCLRGAAPPRAGIASAEASSSPSA